MSRFSLLGKITLASVIGQLIIVAVLESLVIYFHVEFVGNFILDEFGDGISQVDLIYHLIFIATFVFQVLMCIDALINKNPIQLIALVIFNLLTLLYAIIQLHQHEILEDEGTESAKFIPSNRFKNREKVKIYFEARLRPLEYTILAFISTFSVFLAFMAYKLYSEMEWDNYKKYTGDIRIRKAFVTLSILQTLIKMDIFFIGAYAIQLIPSQKMGYSIIETIIIFVLGVTLLLMSWVAVSREKKYVLLSNINSIVISIIYIIYKLFRVNLHPSSSDCYRFTRIIITFFLVTTFVLISATLVYSIICFSNMTKGIYVFEVYNNNDTDIENSSPNSNNTKRYSKKLSLKRKQQHISSDKMIIN
ncbi:hypothetical protein Glove_709g99 [Diversispora epigaea]|uniref:TRP C-terminal domain-containing protein n=1 Tax=Diversispora epigaea TaxID=1348612 RepID=A0A397G9I4_9GLOM|nr:hypothetical protein Glove_709g99 [Diversispora epigaea]